MANHLSEYKNKGKTPDVCRVQRQTSMNAFRKQKRKEFINVNHRQNDPNDVVDISKIETFTVNGFKYIKEFPAASFPIPVGSGHYCENCVEYGCIDDILIGFCYNCMLYKSITPWKDGKNLINLDIDDYKIPSYVTEKHSKIIHQWALQQPVDDEFPGLEVFPELEVPENPSPVWQPPTTQAPTTQPLWQPPTTQAPTTQPLWQPPTTQAPVWQPPTTQAPTTQPLWQPPTTQPLWQPPTTQAPVWHPQTQPPWPQPLAQPPWPQPLAQPPWHATTQPLAPHCSQTTRYTTAQPQPLAQPHTPTYTLEEKRDIPTPTAKDWSFMYI